MARCGHGLLDDARHRPAAAALDRLHRRLACTNCSGWPAARRSSAAICAGVARAPARARRRAAAHAGPAVPARRARSPSAAAAARSGTRCRSTRPARPGWCRRPAARCGRWWTSGRTRRARTGARSRGGGRAGLVGGLRLRRRRARRPAAARPRARRSASASLTLAQADAARPGRRARSTSAPAAACRPCTSAGTPARSCATDVSARALRLAATTAALSGQAWDLRAGLAARPGRRRDASTWSSPTRRSCLGRRAAATSTATAGWPATRVSARLVARPAGVLGRAAAPRTCWPTGSCRPTATGTERVAGWLAGRGCDAWVWQREVADPAEYVTLWLRDAGERPARPEWAARYDAWLDWFAAHGRGRGRHGLRVAVAHRRRTTRCRGARGRPAGGRAAGRRRTAGLDRAGSAGWPAPTTTRCWRAVLRRRGRAWCASAATCSAETGWARRRTARLRQSHGLRWERGRRRRRSPRWSPRCDGRRAARRRPSSVLAAALDRPADEVAAAALPVVRDLVGRGFLLPPGADRCQPMRAVVQRVTRARGATSTARSVGAIGAGLLVLVGVTHDDTADAGRGRWPARCTGCGSCATSAASPTCPEPRCWSSASSRSTATPARAGARPGPPRRPGPVAEPLVDAFVAGAARAGAHGRDRGIRRGHAGRTDQRRPDDPVLEV